ncbi:MAG: hypothetical protein ACK5T0_08945 [Vampirovibrionales bacterium]
MAVNPYFTLPTVTGATASTTDLLASVARADVASKDAIALKTEIQGKLKTAGTNYGGSFQQGFGTSYNLNGTRGWSGAGAFPQYSVSPDGRIVPYINFLDRTAGAGMHFGLPPSVNDVEANLKGIDPYDSGQGGYGMQNPYGGSTGYAAPPQYGGGYDMQAYGVGMMVAGGGSNAAPALPIVELPLVGGGVAK